MTSSGAVLASPRAILAGLADPLGAMPRPLMEIRCSLDEEWTSVELVGRLDLAGVDQIQDEFASCTGERDAHAVIDCAGVDFIASMGIGLFVEAARALKPKGRRIVIFRPTALVEETLRATGVHNIADIVHDDRELAQLKG